jgi:hypothetical protein
MLCPPWSTMVWSARQCFTCPGPLCDAAHANASPVLVHYAKERTPVLRSSWSTMRRRACQSFARPDPLCKGAHASASLALVHYATERMPMLCPSWSTMRWSTRRCFAGPRLPCDRALVKSPASARPGSSLDLVWADSTLPSLLLLF